MPSGTETTRKWHLEFHPMKRPNHPHVHAASSRSHHISIWYYYIFFSFLFIFFFFSFFRFHFPFTQFFTSSFKHCQFGHQTAFKKFFFFKFVSFNSNSIQWLNKIFIKYTCHRIINNLNLPKILVGVLGIQTYEIYSNNHYWS